MASFDTNDLIIRFQNEAGLGTTSEVTDAMICTRLATAQGEVLRRLASRVPEAFYQAPTALTAAADRKTFTFGNDAQGNAIMPMGDVQIANTLSAFVSPEYFAGWLSARDFIDEGTRIRIPGNRAYAGTLYGRWIPTPPDIALGTPNVEPVLNPADVRTLIVLKAVADWASEGNARPDLASVMLAKYASELRTWLLIYRTRYKNGGGMLDPALWWFGASDLGTTG